MRRNNLGFTIVETMIAIGVFSLVASTATIVSIQLSKGYQQAVIRSKLDTSARNINNIFTQAVQYTNATNMSSSPISSSDSSFAATGYPSNGGTWNVWCAGNIRISWQTSYGTTIFKNSLYQDNLGGYTDCLTQAFSLDTAQQLIPKDAFLPLFDITSASSIWELKMSIATGDINSFRTPFITADISTSPITLPNCQDRNLANFSFCGIVYYDNSVSSLVN